MTLQGKIRRAVVSAVFLSAVAASAPAAGDDNPFVPRTPEDLSKPLPETAVRAIVDQAVADAEVRMREQFDSERRAMRGLISGLTSRFSAQNQPATADPTGSTPGEPTSEVVVPPPAPSLPERARFVACVNGKALYRDPEGISFLSEIPPASGVDPCAE